MSTETNPDTDPYMYEVAASKKRQERTARKHVFWKTGEKGAPESIKDNCGDVALSLCKVCGLGEDDIELSEPCEGFREHWSVSPGGVEDTYGEVVANLSCCHENEHKEQLFAQRIVACVNACAGMEDPAQAISDVRELLKSWKRDIESPDDREQIDNVLHALGG